MSIGTESVALSGGGATDDQCAAAVATEAEPRYRGKRVAVVVPAYNEENLIKETLDGIPDYVEKVYAVDDGSADRTYVNWDNPDKVLRIAGCRSWGYLNV